MKSVLRHKLITPNVSTKTHNHEPLNRFLSGAEKKRLFLKHLNV